MKRRKFLLGTSGIVGSFFALAARAAVPCPPPTITAGSTTATSAVCPVPATWNIGPLSFPTDRRVTVDLATTLPDGVPRNGTFGVSSNGAPLRSGMTLTAAGLLSNESSVAGSVVGVVFSYSPPGG